MCQSAPCSLQSARGMSCCTLRARVAVRRIALRISSRGLQQRPPALLRVAHARGFFINAILLIVSRYTAETAFQRQCAIVCRSQCRAAFIALAFVHAIFVVLRAHEWATQLIAQHRGAAQHYAMLQPV